MKRKKFWKDVSRFVTPAALIVLGLVLLRSKLDDTLPKPGKKQEVGV